MPSLQPLSGPKDILAGKSVYLEGYSIPSLFTKMLNAGEPIKMDLGK